MFNPQPANYCGSTPDKRPRLVVVIDTEEQYNWSLGKSRNNTCVRSVRCVERAQVIFDEYRLIPVYVVDYPVASQPDGYRPLQELCADGRCLVGAHLHPWVNPPFEEVVTRQNSFPAISHDRSRPPN
jgi:hypothetical protein